MHEAGYVEGRNIVIEWRDAQRTPDRLFCLAAELGRLKVDLIVADVTLATRAALRATLTVPIVMALAAAAPSLGLQLVPWPCNGPQSSTVCSRQ
jgi:putative ABC transport system substrate-binding protein